MDTKKTIIVSILTTLATMFIVAIIMHMCCGNCGGKSRCGKASAQCSASYGHGDYHGSHGGCASYAKSCHAKKSCSTKKSCSSKSKCSKSGKCCKSKCSKSSCQKGDAKTCKHKDGDKMIIKKTIEKEEK